MSRTKRQEIPISTSFLDTKTSIKSVLLAEQTSKIGMVKQGSFIFQIDESAHWAKRAIQNTDI